MAAKKSLQDLFVNLLKDMYFAEKQILKALPNMAKRAIRTNSGKLSNIISRRPKARSSASSRCSAYVA
jgi:ferritin-like metal-binding protein YciE